MEYLFSTKFEHISIKKTLVIKPFGDIHRDSEDCDGELFDCTMRKWKAEHTPDTYYIGLGDYLEFLSESEQKRIDKIKGDLHKTTRMRMDKEMKDNVEWFVKKIAWMKGHVLGLIDGNHNYRFADNTTAVDYMAKLLDTKNVGWLSYFKIDINKVGKHASVDLVACHGKAGGKLIGSSINQVDDLRMIFPEANIYICGHDHKKSATPVTTLRVIVNKNKLFIKDKDQYLCRSGSFLKAYNENKSSYAVRALYRPNALGTIELYCDLERTTKNTNYVRLSDNVRLKISAKIN